MLDSAEVDNGQELTLERLTEQVHGYTQSFDEIPVDPRHYTILFQSEVLKNGKSYKLIYKASKTQENKLVTKLSLVDIETSRKPDFQDTISLRHPVNPLNVGRSDDDYVLSPEEAAFRYLQVDLSPDPIEIRSRLEVKEALQGQGIGSLLFDSFDLLASDVAHRSQVPDGKQLKLIVRDNSDPVGWTAARAEKNGYVRVPSNQSDSVFPTYQKIITSGK